MIETVRVKECGIQLPKKCDLIFRYNYSYQTVNGVVNQFFYIFLMYRIL